MEVGIGPGHVVLDGDSAPLQKGEQQPIHFSAHVCCDQRAGCIKMPLGMEVGLGLGHIVLDREGTQLSPKRGTAAPQLSAHVCCGQMSG